MQRNYWNVPSNLRASMVENAKKLRRNPTPSQRKLWEAVRGKALGVRVRREQPIGPYIVDFFVASRRLVIEVDGSVHNKQEKADAERQKNIETLGYRVLRFRAEEVMADLDSVLEKLRRAIA